MAAVEEMGLREIVTRARAIISSNSDNSELKKPETDCLTIEDTDFKAVFDGTKWTVVWKWKSHEPELKNQCAEYGINTDYKEQYSCEIEQRISNGWLELHGVKIHGNVSGIIPLMAVFQSNKGRKVRPVMDYSRELNQHVNSNPGNDVAICQEKLRQWRTLGDNVCMLDLKKAYLQLHVDSSLQRFQAVRFNGQLYVMTRLGSGLNVAPKIMSPILAKVLSMHEKIAKGTDQYIDDIVVNEDVVSALKVKNHLQKYGLLSKEPESLSSARVLGLRVEASNSGTLKWSRDFELPEVHSTVTNRELYSICGKYIGHYPVAMWLRVACSYLKREINAYGWDDEVLSNVKKKIEEIDNSMHRHDPVTGQWKVPASENDKVWCDASSLAIGACVEIDNRIVEDANSATVFGWVKFVLQDCKRPKLSGLSEILVKRRLNLLNDLISEYQLVLQITVIKSEDNKADELTRVPHKLLQKRVCAVNLTISGSIEGKLHDLHEAHHLGADRTWYLATERWGPTVKKKDIEKVVKHCHVCKRVDPAPAHWETGQVEAESDWYRLATDVTHYQGIPYLTVIDCRPSSCAYRASGNGVIERNHRTIKRMLARSGGTVNDMLYWYNNDPNADGVVPFQRLFNYNPQKQETTRISAERDISLNPYKMGDQVYVKPSNAKCTSVWKTGKVTSLVSNTAVKVDDMARHIGDIRFCWRVDKQPATLDCELHIANTNESTEGLTNVETPPVTKDSHNNHSTAANNATRPARARKPPDFYVAGFN
ncbi:uncharacterized protein [Watersipora subatra]|uniref:uncharacterized protein n=1 Tax=Watersipora subatra TaxID=2589382 RepID=UPI00355B68A8